MAVAGLNPHAGEAGRFGDEEERLVRPAIEAARARVAAAGVAADISGPHVPDVVFREAAGGRFDAVVALYHDQGLIPLKLLHFDEGVNVTLGLAVRAHLARSRHRLRHRRQRPSPRRQFPRGARSRGARHRSDSRAVESGTMREEQRAAATPLVGTTLGDAYRIVRLIGEGAMGGIYEARQLRLDKRVAIKVLARELAANGEALLRFHREAEITSQLGHPHIITVFDFGTTDGGQPYLVMEYLEGEDLANRLHRVNTLPLPAAVRITKQVASALAETHAKGIVHRDLKPANLFPRRASRARTSPRCSTSASRRCAPPARR